jgi:UDP-glucose 4-epimerase
MDSSEKFKNKKILITGGLGFIGSTLAHRLAKIGAEITLVDSMIPLYGGNLANIQGIDGRIQVNFSDVRDSHSMKYLVQGKDFLFNLAGQTSHLDSMSDPFTDLEINVGAQLSILEACRNHNPDIRIVYAGTRQIYGRPDYLPVNEIHPLRPVDVNGINKLSAEWYHVLYHSVHGIRSSVLRLTNTYGPRMRIKDARQTFMGAWFARILQGLPVEVWGGQQLRDFTYVNDCVDAMLLAACDDGAYGKVYNLGGDCVITLGDLARRMIDIFGRGDYTIKEFPADRKKIDIGDYYSDFRLISQELGWTPKTSLSDGIRMTFEYYREHLAKYL